MLLSVSFLGVLESTKFMIHVRVVGNVVDTWSLENTSSLFLKNFRNNWTLGGPTFSQLVGECELITGKELYP